MQIAAYAQHQSLAVAVVCLWHSMLKTWMEQARHVVGDCPLAAHHQRWHLVP